MATNAATADRAIRILMGIGLAGAAAFGLVGCRPVHRIAGLR
ncbi:hypothetical protein J2X20_002904 [Pelomonas saccharophila]|jgi:hypothetical protein|uniref:Lipoprotein n=1 Tax=Roseateles saccharophilus TaxID=304 RepID=A0ABU1YPW5_ROSSA|nr:hypothetical protein [Roseateles saccharophilus]MDR7270246.1 hypothetical protein [Roseateles saccharophilus]